MVNIALTVITLLIHFPWIVEAQEVSSDIHTRSWKNITYDDYVKTGRIREDIPPSVIPLVSTPAPFDPDIMFNVTESLYDPRFVLMGWNIQPSSWPPSPDRLNDAFAENNDWFNLVQLEWYGTALYIKGNVGRWPFDVWTDSGSLTATTKENSDNEHIYFTSGLPLGNHSTLIVFKQGGKYTARIDSIVTTKGMLCDAPAFEQVTSREYQVVENNTLNTVTPIFDFTHLNRTGFGLNIEGSPYAILDSTPTDAGQQSISYTSLRLSQWAVDSLGIDIPLNSTYFELIGMVGNSSFEIESDKDFFGQLALTRNGDVFTSGLLGPDSPHYMLNATIMTLVLDPREKYKIYINPTALNGKSSQLYLHSAKIYSAIWTGQSPGSPSEQETSANSETSERPESAPKDDGLAQDSVEKGGSSKPKTGAIAGGVIGGVLGAALLLGGAFFLGRRSSKSKQPLDDDEEDLDGPEMAPVQPFINDTPSSFVTGSTWSQPNGSSSGSAAPSEVVREKQLYVGPSSSASTPSPAPTSPPAFSKAREAAQETEEAGLLPPPPPPALTVESPDEDIFEDQPQDPDTESDSGSEGYTELLPPNYNPQWGTDARARGAYEERSASPPSAADQYVRP